MTRANSCTLQISNSEALTDIHMTRTLESEVVNHLTFLAHRIYSCFSVSNIYYG